MEAGVKRKEENKSREERKEKKEKRKARVERQREQQGTGNAAEGRKKSEQNRHREQT